MINWNQVLNYIKGRLALPSTFIEQSDEEIKNWLINTALRDLSTYHPDIEWTSVLTNHPDYQVPDRQNHWLFFDEEDLDIFGVRDVYFSLAHEFITGHPPFGAFSFENHKWWALDVFKSRYFKKYSHFDYTTKYIPPNMIRVLPRDPGNFVVEYERLHPPDLRRIRGPLVKPFMDLCLGEIMLWVGQIRSHYGEGRLQTPFGEIPLNGEMLKSEGKELKQESIELLKNESIPEVIIDVH
ncbi:MAG: hypothetical protein ACOCQD_02685 [archaeon]